VLNISAVLKDSWEGIGLSVYEILTKQKKQKEGKVYLLIKYIIWRKE